MDGVYCNLPWGKDVDDYHDTEYTALKHIASSCKVGTYCCFVTKNFIDKSRVSCMGFEVVASIAIGSNKKRGSSFDSVVTYVRLVGL